MRASAWRQFPELPDRRLRGIAGSDQGSRGRRGVAGSTTWIVAAEAEGGVGARGDSKGGRPAPADDHWKAKSRAVVAGVCAHGAALGARGARCGELHI